MGCHHHGAKDDQPGAAGGPPGQRAAERPAAGTVRTHANLLEQPAQAAPADAGRDPEGAAAEAFDAAAAAALAKARPLYVRARSGAEYRSEDGGLVVAIPPGALDRDGPVRFAAVDTARLPGDGQGTPGLFVTADLGAAAFNPDASLSLKARVDRRFVAAVTRGGDTPESLGMSRATDGQWLLPVVVRPDAVGRPEAVSLMQAGKATVREVARLPVRPAAVPERALAEAEPYALPTPARGVPTLPPAEAADPLVRRYPAMPAADAQLPRYHPVESLDAPDGPGLKVRRTVLETTAGLPIKARVGVMCSVEDPCRAKVTSQVVAAVRLNDALLANRQPPEGLCERAHDPLPPGCGGPAAVVGQR